MGELKLAGWYGTAFMVTLYVAAFVMLVFSPACMFFAYKRLRAMDESLARLVDLLELAARSDAGLLPLRPRPRVSAQSNSESAVARSVLGP